ncbi:MAG: glycoside hydrolase family 26 protein [Actinobacteria bacterium]|nr:glycoside hydrolase family 26 protein [Actinomycetota bacterium]
MPTGSTAASHSAGCAAASKPARRQRLLRIVAGVAVLILAGGAAAVDRSRGHSSSALAAPAAASGLALVHDNLNGASAATRPTPSAARSAQAKAKARAKAKQPTSAGFVSNSGYIPGTGQTYLGAAGDSQALARSTGVSLSDHSYAFFSGRVPTGRMITVKDSGTWQAVAAAAPGSALYNNIVRWAQTIKARGGVVMFAYHHEPEGANSKRYGTSADYIAAYRRVITIFRSQGVNNVNYTWQMTAWAFRASPSDPRYAGRWYPGDDYVDSVGADAYNWASCGEGSGRWEELKTLGDPVLAFAAAHGKRAAFPEFASNADPRRAQWTYNALQYIAANRGRITGAFYFHRPPTVAANSDCR